VQLLDGDFVFSATDLNDYLECRYLIAREREVASGTLTRPRIDDPTVDLIGRKGDEHERALLARYVATYGEGVVQFATRATNTRAGLREAEARTLAAMASGAQIVYQATFFDGTFVGHADFLRRVETPSARFAWSYEVLDTKLALSPKPSHIIQLCNYSEHLARLQGTPPEYGYIVFGDGEARAFRMASFGAYYGHLKSAFLAFDDTADVPYPLEVPHCGTCVWETACAQRRAADDHLSLVAGMRADQIAKLEASDVTTMTALAASTVRPQRMTQATFENLRVQATLQVEQRRRVASGDPFPFHFRFREHVADPVISGAGADAETNHPGTAATSTGARVTMGFAKLPAPDAGDLFFDIEGDPLYRPERGLEYLFGLYVADEDRYVAFWAKDATEERAAFEACVDFMAERLRQYPAMHVYHYAAYERSALSRLMGEFGSREREIDRFFTVGLFVDLYAVVRQALWISQPSYSLKKVEALYGWERETETKGGADSIEMFERWLVSHDDAVLDDIERYNEDDVRSTHALHTWLLSRREEYNATHEALAWRATVDTPEAEAPLERTALEHALLDNLPELDGPQTLRAWPEELRERWLVGNVLQYHRRENKPGFWEYFKRCESVEDLAEFDRKAIGGLQRLVEVAPYKRKGDRNFVYTFTYPVQEHDLRGTVECPDLRKPISGMVAHDEVTRTFELKLSEEMAASLRALVPGKPIQHKTRQLGIERIATALLDGRLASDHPATSALLRGSLPRLRGRTPGARLQPAIVDAASLTEAFDALDGSYLFVQGPPGSGKSTLGAAAIVSLLAAGKRIGLMANSHKAIHNLLWKIEETADACGVTFVGVHKASSSTDDSDYESKLATPLVRSEATASGTAGAQLVSGTTFFWPDETLVGAFDLMVIDEAGQVSLADALNASMAARNVVLLGDPRQLPQVVQGFHPFGASASILEHLLGAGDTVAIDRGIFLDRSFRMEPRIARFVSETSYENRLGSGDNTTGNRVDSPGLCGGGLVFLPVTHSGNGRYSIEEAERIVAEIAQLVRGTFTRDHNPARTLSPHDILVVAPYNLQRQRIRQRLDAAGLHRVAVGTVDKFQGQQAPVVFYSMATSSDDDLPRDMGFLFDRNRFNVAISRAQCMSILVCSPRLLDTRCRIPEQMLLVNLLCGFVERALRVSSQALPETARLDFLTDAAKSKR